MDATSRTPPPLQSETEFLAAEADLAERGLVGAVEDVGRDLVYAVSPRRHLREHPIATIAAILGGVLVLAPLVKRSRRWLRQHPSFLHDASLGLGSILGVIVKSPSVHRAVERSIHMMALRILDDAPTSRTATNGAAPRPSDSSQAGSSARAKR